MSKSAKRLLRLVLLGQISKRDKGSRIVKWLAVHVLVCLLVCLRGPEGHAQPNPKAAGEPPPIISSESTYPKRSITIIAPASPGGGWDQLARVMQHALITGGISEVPVEVVNRGGAGGTIGLTELITRHRRDPHTWMVGGSTLVSAMLMHESRFNLSETELLARLASEYNVVAVPVDSPIRTMEELVSAFKNEPSSFIWGGGSAGSADHLLVGLIAREVGVDPSTINYVAYPGGGEGGAALLGNQINAGVAGYAEWKDLAEAEELRIIGISSSERLDGVDIPTLKDAGLNIELENWRFVVAGPGLKDEDRDQILRMISAMRSTPEWQKVLETYSWQDRFLTGPELEEYIAAETEHTAKLLDELGLSRGAKSTFYGPYLFPTLILILLLVTSGLMGVQSLRTRRGVSAESEAEGAVSEEARSEWRRFAMSASLILGYIVSLSFIGFVVSTPVYFVLQARIIGSKALVRDLIIACLFTLLAYFIFENLLSINVP